MAPANTANLTRNTTTDRKTLSRLHQFAPRARHQTDVVFPPKRDSAASGAARPEDRITKELDAESKRASSRSWQRNIFLERR
jgi:hypothetical protein